jgi:hypothetical protein
VSNTIDARVTEAARAKLADKYEQCFRRIMKYIDRANDDDDVGIPEMYSHIVNDLVKTFTVRKEKAGEQTT